ncbi:discoidin domain-containing protein [Jiangella asiatica]|uniref:Discoidin domain-containing protein n=1 Tax=Jiangella asiatica TaxID=2530372 RepID=A0A4R5DH70_9ACTN|nr:discoidin domain-containing protein [Jiangella asiatica]TDE11204.1 discoidin domain-containing protein [Jiangella asiatica]
MMLLRRTRVVPAVTALASALVASLAAPPTTAAPATAAPVTADRLTSTAGEMAVGADWVIVHGSDAVERTAADHLAGQLADHLGAPAPLEVREAGSTLSATAWLRRENLGSAAGVIVVGTVADHPLAGIAHRRDPFDLPGDSPEAYHLDARTDGTTDVLYVVGASPKGAMNGVFRLEQHIEREASLDVAALNEAAEPAFVNRVGGHRFTQSPPPDWTDDQQGRYYAENYINVVWGEKHGAPLPADVREKWGLKLAYEVPLPGVGAAWFDDPANESSTCVRGDGTRTIDPFTPRGAQAYADVFAAALAQHDDIVILETLFGDYSHIPTPNSIRAGTDGETCDIQKSDVAVEIMRIMKDVIGDRDVTPMAWMWHLYPAGGDAATMARLRDLGVGILYNEDGNGDNWVTRRTNFSDVAIDTVDETGVTTWGPDYASLVSAGGSCESVKPVIGLPVPHAAASKLHALAEIGVRNFYLWWGGVEGWTYSANLSVIREMIWDPGLFDPTDTTPFDAAHPEPLLNRVATTDFGADRAPDVLRYWSLVDRALVDPSYATGDPAGLRVYSWYQRLAIYLNPAVLGGGAALRPITPDGLKSNPFTQYRPWGTDPDTIANFTQVAAELARANQIGAQLDDGTSARFAQMRHWTELYTHVFTSRLHFLQGLRVADQYTDVDDPAFRVALEPIAAAEIDTIEAMETALASMPPNATFFDGTRVVVQGAGDREKDLDLLAAKRLATQAWLDGEVNLAAGRPVNASSAPDQTRQPALAVDRDWTTEWRSAPSSGQWISVGLGEVMPVDLVLVRWNPNQTALSYQVQVADSASGPWTTVATITEPTGRDDAIPLPAGTTARQVRIVGGQPAANNLTIRELEVYGP